MYSLPEGGFNVYSICTRFLFMILVNSNKNTAKIKPFLGYLDVFLYGYKLDNVWLVPRVFMSSVFLVFMLGPRYLRQLITVSLAGVEFYFQTD